MEQRAAASAAPDMSSVAPDTPPDGASQERAAWASAITGH